MPRRRLTASLATPDDVEQQFYEALRGAHVERLMEIWHDDEDIACVHPGGGRVLGLAAIRASFEEMLSSGGVDIHAETVRRVQTAGCSVHSVVERVHAMTSDGPRSAWVLATNVFIPAAEGWRMVLHHASPGAGEPVVEAAEPGALLH